MYYSELVKDERLLQPIAPDKVCKVEKHYVSTKIFSSVHVFANSDYGLINESYCSDDILFIDRVGQLFKVYHEVGDDGEWLWAQCLDKKEFGLLMADCVKCVVGFRALILY
jgi:hypothetical protein